MFVVMSGWRKWALCFWTSYYSSKYNCGSWTPSNTLVLWICIHFSLKLTDNLKWYAYIFMCIFLIDIKCCRLLTWFKQSLMSRREMNIFKSWWCYRIRLSVWLRSHIISFIFLMLFTCTNSHPTHSSAEVDGDYWEGTPKCWFSEGSRCDPKCS